MHEHTGSIAIYPNKYCVYRHLVNGAVIYVGKGTTTRPFQLDRSERWTIAAKHAKFIVVEIVRWFDTEDEALRFESEEIERLKPPGNSVGILSANPFLTRTGREARPWIQPADTEDSVRNQKAFLASQALLAECAEEPFLAVLPCA